MIVTSHTVFRDSFRRPLSGRWSYDTVDPHAIQLRLNGTVWVFGRALLELALSRRCCLVGDGDVQLNAGLPGPRLWVNLQPPSGALRVSCPLSAVEGFVHTLHTVAPVCAGCDGPECAQCAPVHAELDAVLAGILNEQETL